VATNVFIQAFDEGRPVHMRADAVLAVVEPYVVSRESGYASLQTSDGGADLWGYGEDGGLAVVDPSGAEIWDIVVALAQVTGAAIIPVGGVPIVVDTIRIADLPEDVRMSAGLVSNGHELMLSLGIGRGVSD
jgi:hypothetical protein